MKRLASLTLLSIIAIASANAQIVVQENDSVISNIRKEFMETGTASEMKQAEVSSSYADLPEIDRVNMDAPAIDLHLNLNPKGSTLPSWSTGYITGNHGTYRDMNIGAVNYANAAIVQSLNRYWSASAGINLTKYSVYSTQASFNGSLQYRPNRNFGITIFGSYSPGTFNSPMKIGESFYYGGYVSLETDNHWGIDLGVAQSYDGMSNMHNTTPIVRPYYNLNGAKLGIDFGPMIQGMMRKSNHSTLEFNPMGPRPIKNLPAVAPRR